jgi:hypothetical protein
MNSYLMMMMMMMIIIIIIIIIMTIILRFPPEILKETDFLVNLKLRTQGSIG